MPAGGDQREGQEGRLLADDGAAGQADHHREQGRERHPVRPQPAGRRGRQRAEDREGQHRQRGQQPGRGGPMPSPSRSSSRTGPTLTAAGRRLSDSRRMPSQDQDGRSGGHAAGPYWGRLVAVRHIPTPSGGPGWGSDTRSRPASARPTPRRDEGGRRCCTPPSRPRSTSRCGPGSTGYAGRRRPGALRRPHRWSSSSRCGALCSSSRATCCPPRGGARPPGWPSSWRPGWPRRSRRPATRRTAPRGWRRRGPAWSTCSGRQGAHRPGDPTGRARAGGAARPGARQEVRRQRLDRPAGAHPARASRAPWSAARTPATGGCRSHAGR